MKTSEIRKMKAEADALAGKVAYQQKRRDKMAKILRFLRNTYEYRTHKSIVKFNPDTLDIYVYEGPDGLGDGYLSLGYLNEMLESDTRRALGYPSFFVTKDFNGNLYNLIY